MIQRRLAWPLRKDDTQIREAFHIFRIKTGVNPQKKKRKKEKAVACLHTLQPPFNRQESRRQLKVYKTVYRVTTEYDIENNEIRPFLEMCGFRDNHTNYGSHTGKNI